jgi:hypothetical protein
MINRNFSKLILSTVLALAGSLVFASVAFATTVKSAPCILDQNAIHQLKAAQQATAKYHSVDAAEADLYHDIHLPIEHMGQHYWKDLLVNDGGVFDPATPELLVYQDIGNGERRLVAVEYAVRITDSPSGPPEGFSGDCDHWDTFADTFWTLHAWIWAPNPDGVFSEFNPQF